MKNWEASKKLFPLCITVLIQHGSDVATIPAQIDKEYREKTSSRKLWRWSPCYACASGLELLCFFSFVIVGCNCALLTLPALCRLCSDACVLAVLSLLCSITCALQPMLCFLLTPAEPSKNPCLLHCTSARALTCPCPATTVLCHLRSVVCAWSTTPRPAFGLPALPPPPAACTLPAFCSANCVVLSVFCSSAV
jgi:hypothetical protein